MKDFSAYWCSQKKLDVTPAVLKNINLKIYKGKSYGIVGKVGIKIS